ncbi:MAG: permease [Lachnospiraceae bacterium]|nr:permease [Lachnospiraceae bacterium]
METFKSGWGFFQDEVLGMKWLNRLIGRLLEACGLDVSGRIGGSVQFFLYDTIKIMVLLGFLILLISYIQSYFPPERTKKILGRFHGIGANIIAVLLGTVTPFCSCSSIPLFIGFTSAGLPLGVTFSFLISSPMVDLGSLVLLMSIFGWKVAIVYVVLGLVVAVAGGTLIEKLRLDDQVEEFIRKGKSFDVPQDKLYFKDRMKYAWEQVVATVKKVEPYVLIGVAIGAVIHNWIPKDFIVRTLGTGNPFGVIIATIAGVPMYADIFGTIPIAEALLAKGAQLGVVLSFMMGVTTLSLPSMIMLKKAVKLKLLGIFAAICTAGIITVGYFFNVIQYLLVS